MKVASTPSCSPASRNTGACAKSPARRVCRTRWSAAWPGPAAAVGPVVAADLERLGVRVDVMPADSFFMKPLVSELVRLFTGSDAPADC